MASLGAEREEDMLLKPLRPAILMHALRQTILVSGLSVHENEAKDTDCHLDIPNLQMQKCLKQTLHLPFHICSTSLLSLSVNSISGRNQEIINCTMSSRPHID